MFWWSEADLWMLPPPLIRLFFGGNSKTKPCTAWRQPSVSGRPLAAAWYVVKKFLLSFDTFLPLLWLLKWTIKTHLQQGPEVIIATPPPPPTPALLLLSSYPPPPLFPPVPPSRAVCDWDSGSQMDMPWMLAPTSLLHVQLSGVGGGGAWEESLSVFPCPCIAEAIRAISQPECEGGVAVRWE